MQIISLQYFYPSTTGGILHFNFKCPLRNPGDAFHSHVNFKIHLTEAISYTTLHHIPKIAPNLHTIHKTTSTITSTHHQNILQPIPIINCQTIIKFTKISRNPKNYIKSPLVHHPNLPPSIPNSSFNQAFKQTSPHHKSTSKIRLDTELTLKPYRPHKNNPIKIRPEFKIPVLNHIS